jgi:hypothetical protein
MRCESHLRPPSSVSSPIPRPARSVGRPPLTPATALQATKLGCATPRLGQPTPVQCNGAARKLQGLGVLAHRGWRAFPHGILQCLILRICYCLQRHRGIAGLRAAIPKHSMRHYSSTRACMGRAALASGSSSNDTAPGDPFQMRLSLPFLVPPLPPACKQG